MGQETTRRTHCKVVELGLQADVERLLQQNLTYKDIEDYLREHGHDIDQSSIYRYNQSIQRKLEQVRRMNETAQTLLDEMRKGGAAGEEGEAQANMQEMLVHLMTQNLVAAATEDELTPGELLKLAMSTGAIAKSQEAIEKMRQSERKRFRRAWERATAEMRRLLEKSGIWTQVEDVLAKGMKEALPE